MVFSDEAWRVSENPSNGLVRRVRILRERIGGGCGGAAQSWSKKKDTERWWVKEGTHIYSKNVMRVDNFFLRGSKLLLRGKIYWKVHFKCSSMLNVDLSS